MFANTLISAALLGCLALAEESTNLEKYPKMYSATGIWGYDFKAHEVVTDDGYTLSLMEILPKHGAGDKEPMIGVHACGSNPHDWLNYQLAAPENTPLLLQILEDGHPLFMLYARGTEYSLKHETLDPMSEEFWDFSWEEIGTQDVTASLDYVYQLSGKKSNLLGYSMGTTEIFAGLALKYDFFKERTNKVVQFSPCTVSSMESYPKVVFNAATINLIEHKGIFEIGGPTWPSTVVKMRELMGVKNLAEFLAGGWGTRLTNVSADSMYHYAQNAQQDRFQRYAPKYWSLNPFDNQKTTELYDLSVIQDIPIGLFIGANDTTCAVSQSEITRDIIGAMVQYNLYEGIGHGDMLVVMSIPEIVADVLNFIN